MKKVNEKKIYEIWLGIPAAWKTPDGHDEAIYVVPANDDVIGYSPSGFKFNDFKRAIREAYRYYTPNVIIIERPTNKMVWNKREA